MSTSRSAKIEQLSKALRKPYQTVPTVNERSVLDHLIYACVLEDSTYDAADEAIHRLLQNYVDYNEIRVTTAVELAEAMGKVTVPIDAAHRLKRILQSIYESRYAFDIDDLKKSNLAKAIETLSALKGMTRFVLNYVSQMALGGHAIPLGKCEMELALATELVTPAEAEKGSVPGLERAIPKTKGLEFSQLLHQASVDFVADYKNAKTAALFKELKIKYVPAPPPVEEPTAKPAKKSKSDKQSAAAEPAAVATKAVTDKVSPTKSPEKISSEKATTEKSAAGKPSSEKISTDKASAAKPTVDKKNDEVAVVDAKPSKKSKATEVVAAKSAEPKPVASKPAEAKKVTAPKKTAAKEVAKDTSKKVAKATKEKPPTKSVTKGGSEVKKPAKPMKKAVAAKEKTPSKPKTASKKNTKATTSISKKKPR